MPFDNSTRNRLQRLVSDCRDLLTREFDAQLQELFGIYAGEGRVLDLEKLPHLDDEKYRVATLMRERIQHLASGGGGTPAAIGEAVKRVLREQAFTVLNRFAALRMAEERGIIVESVGGGLNSKGFKTYSEVAASGLGTAYERYRVFLGCMFDELAVDLGVLFDRQSPFGLLFPRENVLLELFELLNATEVKALWKEDETIGWVYQYFNDPNERKKMREQSAAPRNSRELAVRNQFFTPRYVVEFLTDNTLGRIWYEMTQGETSLKEQCRYLVSRPNEIFIKSDEAVPEQSKQDNLSQEELLKQPVHIPHRPLKDPRTILMLDPACGSMHFGLYAFDLFEVIYNEAWELEERLDADALSRPQGMTSLHSSYASKDAFLKDVPRLVIEHNIHGIDIDPRCAQIAGLSLWLRAQKAWQRLGLKPADRPRITRSNIVCAEPMPGEKELLREFVEKEFPAAERGVFLLLLESIFDKMQLAGEAGSLLKIEEEIKSAVEAARGISQKLQNRPKELFSTGELNAVSKQPELTDLEQAVQSAVGNLGDSGSDKSVVGGEFWETAENRIYAALRDYSEQAENGGGFQRRLFAEDAARGFAFIDVCRKRYDVALMNPPFGSFTIAMAGLAKTVFGRLANDIYACFVRRMGDILAEGGVVGIISSRSFVTGKGMEALRPHLLGEGETWLKLLWDFGVGVLDGAMVETAAYVYCRSTREPAAPIGFWNDKLTDKATLQFPSANRFSEKSYVFFRSLPSQQFIYEADDEVRNGLNSARRFEPHLGRVTKGLSTGSNERFVRCLWEIPQHELKSRWEFLSKGGEYRWLSCDLHLALNWGGDGRELAVFSDITNGNPARARQSSAYYFKPAVCFSGRSQKGFSARWLPAGCIFDTKSPVVVPKDVSDLPWIAPVLMSSEYQRLISLQSKFGSYDTSAIARLPLPQDILTVFVGSLPEIWFPHLKLERATETTWYFVQPATDLDSLRAQALESLGRIDELLQETGRSLDLEVRAYTEDSIRSHDCFSGTQSGFLSYCLGVALGRWDIRYATGEQAAPELPDPFAPLPVCPAGQLQNVQGLPVTKAESGKLKAEGYPIEIPWDGILADDPNHPLDIERRVRQVLEVIWKDRAEAIEQEACEILGVKSLRDYFRKPTGFFTDHLKRYSKSRRQAPIYWPISTASGSYTLWIYYHRLTDQTLFQCVNDFVKPKIAEVEGDLARLTTAGADKPGARSEIERLTTFRAELVEFRDELLRVAQLPYKPNLNDGVLITAAPLWKLFRLPKWQKDLKACWEKLDKGEYDWAHLAYTLWPNRVKDACKKDRSIAIAHGLEELCEVKAPEKKAKKGKKKKDEVQPEFDEASG